MVSPLFVIEGQGITKIEKIIAPEIDYTILLAEKGWQLDIPRHTFLDDKKLTLNIFSGEESSESDFNLMTVPVEVKINDRENIRLQKPVQINIKIPQRYMKPDMALEEFFYGYKYNGKWEYYIPASINPQTGMVKFSTYHFSWLGFGKPTREEQAQAYAREIAMKEWYRQEKSTEFKKKSDQYFEEIFTSMGIKDKTLRNKLTADVISFMENATIESGNVSPLDSLAQMTNSASQGEEGKQAFRNKLIEFTGKALITTLEEKVDKYRYTELVNVFGNLSSAAGSIAEGDKKAALQHVATMLKGVHPVVALADSTSSYLKEKINDGINYWTKAEIEKAYQVYAHGKGGKWGYEEGLEGDFDTIFTLLGGGDRQLNIRIIEKYCQKWGIEESDLTWDRRYQIIDNVKQSLKESFEKRKVVEAKMKTEQDPLIARQQDFIAELMNESLLSPYKYRDYFRIERYGSNYEVRNRLDRLYRIKRKILNIMDNEAAAAISDRALVKAMSQWIYWNEKGNVEEFYKYMREMGYIKTAEVIQEKEKKDEAKSEKEISDKEKVDLKEVWVLKEIQNNDSSDRIKSYNKKKKGSFYLEGKYSPGVFTLKRMYTGKTESMEPYDDAVNGEYMTLRAEWSSPPEVINPGEKLNLTVVLSCVENNRSFYKSTAWVNAKIDNRNFRSDYDDSIKINVNTDFKTVEETLWTTPRKGREAGDTMEIKVFMSSTVPMSTVYVYEWKE